MTISHRLISLALFGLLGSLASPVLAQNQVDPSSSVPPGTTGLPGDATAPPPTAGMPAAAAPAPAPAPAASERPDGDWSVTVHLRHGTEPDENLANQPILLHAVRPQGPFQAGAPQRLYTWTGVTGSDGVARITGIGEDVAIRGLRLQASTSFGGISFESAPRTPGDGIDIPLTVYDRGHDLSGLRIRSKRVVVEPWEEFLIFSQFITFELEGDHAVDISLSPQPELERGLPIRLPVRAQGIHFTGPGDSEVINNVIFWNTVLRPGHPVSVQIRFSKAARSSELTYEQTMEFPVDDIQIIAPIQTQYSRLSRLDNLSLVAPGFDVGADATDLGLRQDMEFLIATGASVDAGESYTFRVEGLPFGRPIGGFVALIAGILGAGLVLTVGRREMKRLHGGADKGRAIDVLSKERDRLMDRLRGVVVDRRAAEDADDEAAVFALEAEEARLREQLALVLRNLSDLQSDGPS